MTVKELKEQTEWMPDDYEVVLINVCLIQEDAGVEIIDIQPNHDKKQIIVTVN